MTGTTSRTAVLAANDALYAAMRAGDIGAMAGLWATRRAVSCGHPGLGLLMGRADVMDSWQQVLSGGGVEIRAEVHWLGVFDRTALVLCSEHIRAARLIAVNGFVCEAGTWRLMDHLARASD